jgi:DNA-binding CsgD family transcriptional regulator
MKTVNLPSGLEDKGLEIYIHNGALRVTYNGKATSFDKLPAPVRDAFASHLAANKSAQKSLREDFGITDPETMLEQYVKCNFGSFDFVPDRNESGAISPECWDCGCRGNCPGEGKVCRLPEGPGGMLAKKETQVYFMVKEGKYDKEIADIMTITMATLRTHLQRVHRKLACNNRIELMKFKSVS